MAKLSRREKFEEFHANNPHVYHIFKQLTFKAVNAGATKLSAWWVINVARWEMAFTTTDFNSDFKISNDYIAYYSRMFMRDFPQHKGLFDTKMMKDDFEASPVERIVAQRATANHHGGCY